MLIIACVYVNGQENISSSTKAFFLGSELGKGIFNSFKLQRIPKFISLGSW